jgi:hypothetical protein
MCLELCARLLISFVLYGPSAGRHGASWCGLQLQGGSFSLARGGAFLHLLRLGLLWPDLTQDVRKVACFTQPFLDFLLNRLQCIALTETRRR